MVLLFAPSVFASGVEIVYDMEFVGEGKPLKVESRYFLQDGSGRIETDLPGSLMDSVVLLLQKEKHRTILLTPGKDTYMILSDSLKKEVPSKGEKFTKTKRSKKIAGHTCQVFTRKRKGIVEEVCLNTTALKKPEFKSLKAIDQYRRFPFLPYGIEAFPLEYRHVKEATKNNKAQKSLVRVRTFSRKKLKSALFVVPKDFVRTRVGTLHPKTVDPMLSPTKPAGEVPLDVQRRIYGVQSFVRETSY